MPKISSPCFIEAIEPRQFCSVSYYNDGSQGNADGTFFASVLYGDNGDENGVPTSASGVNDQVSGVAYYNWVADIDDGLDSGNQNILFSVSAYTKSATLMVANENSGDFAVSSSTTVHSVELRAAVAAPGMEFKFSDVCVNFYHGSSVVEMVDVNDLDADTRNATDWNGAEAAAVITPTASNVTGVKVVATFQMKANAGVYPGPTDVSGQIFVR